MNEAELKKYYHRAKKKCRTKEDELILQVSCLRTVLVELHAELTLFPELDSYIKTALKLTQ